MNRVLLKLYLVACKEVTIAAYFNFFAAFGYDINYIKGRYSQKTC
jgi:hypothetical protein